MDQVQFLPAWRMGNILDIRQEALFCVGHLANSVSHPVDVDALAANDDSLLEEALPSIFLPPRHEQLLIVGHDTQTALRMSNHLRQRGRAEVGAVILPLPVTEVPPALKLERGVSRRHLWKPPPWLEKHENLLPPPVAGPILDLACGSGRAAVWLADKGYRVTGIDWQPEALEMGHRLAKSRGVSCDFKSGDLRKMETVPPGPWAALLNFRFLQRELLESATKWLKPGGVVFVRTFRDVPGYDGHPHRRHRLLPAELTNFFPAGIFEILAHEENHDPDGRPAAGIVARKRISLPHEGK